MRKSLFFAALLALVALVPVGAQAGQPVNQAFTCPRGSFLTGLQGHAGNWLDQFQPICRPWTPAHIGAESYGDNFGNVNGGSPALIRASCAPGAAMFGIDYNVVSPNGPPGHVQGVSVRCANLPYFDGVRDVALDGQPGGQGIFALCGYKNGKKVGRDDTIANGLVIGLDGINIASLDVVCDTPANIEAAAPSPIRARFNARAIRSVP